MPPQLKGWKLNKEVPITLLVALIAYGASGIWFMSSLAAKVNSAEVVHTALHDYDKQQDADNKQRFNEIREDYRDINRKLDRLIERGQSR